MTFRELLEDKDAAKAIRDILKKEFKLSSRDVSVTSEYSGTSSSVRVKLKNRKALPYQNKIEDISKNFEKYDTDDYSGEILMGGNTFIFVDIDYKLMDELSNLVKKEFEKQTKGVFEINDEVTLFKVFKVKYFDKGSFIISVKSSRNNLNVSYQEGIYSGIINLIQNINKPELLDKIK